MDTFRLITGVVQVVIAAIATAIALDLLPSHPELLALLLAIQNAMQGTRHVTPLKNDGSHQEQPPQ